MGVRFILRPRSILLTLSFFTLSSEVARGQTQEIQEEYFGSAAGYKRFCRERCCRLAEWLKMPVDASAFAKPMSFKEFIGALHEQWTAKNMDLPILVDWYTINEQSRRLLKPPAFASAEDLYTFRLKFSELPSRVSGDWLLREALAQIPPKNLASCIHRLGFVEVTTQTRSIQAQIEFLYEDISEHFTAPLAEAMEYVQWIVSSTAAIKESVDEAIFDLFGFPKSGD